MSSDIAAVDIAVVGSDPLWVVDNMNRLHNELPGSVVRDYVTVLEALDDLTPGEPAVLVLAPEISGGAEPVIEALAGERPELALIGTVDPNTAGTPAGEAISSATGFDAPPADDHARIVDAVAAALRDRREAVETARPVDPPADALAGGPDDDAPARAIAEGLGSGSRLVTVTAGKGGVGTTTVAINLAAASVAEGGRAILVDGHGATGDVGIELGLAPPSHDELDDRSLTSAAVGRLLVTHEGSGVEVAVLPTIDEHLAGIPAARLLDLLLALDGRADLIVVDAPVELVRDAQLRTFSEHVLVVTSGLLSSIKDTRVVVSALAEGGGERLGVVLNHPVEHRGRADASDIAPAVGVPVIAELPFDDHLGDPEHPVAVAPTRSGYGRALRDLAALVGAETDPAWTGADARRLTRDRGRPRLVSSFAFRAPRTGPLRAAGGRPTE